MSDSKNVRPAPVRLAALCCVLALVVGLLPTGFLTQQAYASYPARSKCDTSWYSAGRSQFTLSTAKQLAGLAYLVDEQHVDFAGKTITLAGDIDLSSICTGNVDWRPIGWGYSSGTPFKGTFDGRNHRISGLKIDNSGFYNALFGKVEDATIKNLTVAGEVYGTDYVAGIISYCSESDLSNLVNECTVDAVRYNQGTAHEGMAAGVVCYSATAYSKSDHVYERLENYGEIRACSHYTAGVVGFLYNDTGHSTSLIECANYGSVDVSAARYDVDDVGDAVGGVLGSTAGDYGTYYLKGCLNEGDIYTANCVSIGGVAGYLGGLGSSIEFSENVGSVSGSDNSGGIVGYMGSAGGSVSGSLNLGVVSGANSAGVIGAGSRNGQTFARNYTWDEVSDAAYGSSVGAVNDKAVRSADRLRLQKFLDLINAGTTEMSIVTDVYGGLPVLTWKYGSGLPGGGGLEGDDPEDDDDDDENPPDEPDGPGTGEGNGEGNGSGDGSGTGDGDGSGDGGSETPGTGDDNGGSGNAGEGGGSGDSGDSDTGQGDNTGGGTAHDDTDDGSQTDVQQQTGQGSGRTDESEDRYTAQVDPSEAPDIQMEPEEEPEKPADSADTADNTAKRDAKTETLILEDDTATGGPSSGSSGSDAGSMGGSDVEQIEESVEIPAQERMRMVELTVIDDEDQPAPEVDLTMEDWVYLLAAILAACCVGAGLTYEYVTFSRSRRTAHAA